MSSQTSRRRFLKSAATFAGSFPMLGGLPLKRPATLSLDKLRTAHIGVGGMGKSDLGSIASHKNVEIAALCDVDANLLTAAAAGHKSAKTFVDFREMISAMGDKIDAVVISTPDHTHAPAAMTAMLAGKPVYCQKPLTHEIFESRQLRIVAREKKLVTQMGVQVHSHPIYRRAVRMIQDGVLGKVSQVHAWSNKNWGYDGPAYANAKDAPKHLSWNLWLGPAPNRPFMPKVYHPGNWRKIIDFGTGTLGDMGVHIFDTPFTALELTAPNWVKTTCRKPTGVGHPEQNVVEYEFPGTKFTTDKLLWTWYDGSNAPPAAKDVGLPEATKNAWPRIVVSRRKGPNDFAARWRSDLVPREKLQRLSTTGCETKQSLPPVGRRLYGQWQNQHGFRSCRPFNRSIVTGCCCQPIPRQEIGMGR